MIYHILNGDSLAYTFKETTLEGEKIVCRECLIEGGLGGKTLEEFFLTRANFLSPQDTDQYYRGSVNEFKKILNLPEGSDICLWFEDDLFCQINLWFIIHLLKASQRIYRVFPEIPAGEDHWKGFGLSDAALLEKAWQQKKLLSESDIALGRALWEAYKNNDRGKLHELSMTPSSCFLQLPAVVKAHLDRVPDDGGPGRPEKTIRSIMNDQPLKFSDVFPHFCKHEGIYGFGDDQLKPIYDKVLNDLT